MGLSLAVLALAGAAAWFLLKRPGRLPAEVAAMVNGRPIPAYRLAEILSSAQLNESLTTPGRRQGLTRMIMEGLIEEELAVAGAETAGLTVSPEEALAWAAYFAPDPLKPGAAAVGDTYPERFLEIVRRRLLIKNFLERLAAKGTPEAADWREFASSWRARPKPGSYLVRVMILPDLETAREIQSQENRNLDRLATGLKKAGRPVLLSSLFWLPEEAMEPALLLEAEKMSRGGPDGYVYPAASWSEPLPFAGHQAIYEFVRLARGRPYLEELGCALIAFKAAWREVAYQNWLAGEKSRARIQLNPDLDLTVGSLWAEGQPGLHCCSGD